MPPKEMKRLPLALLLAATAGPALADDLSSNLQINGFATAGFTSVTEDYGGRYLSDIFDPSSGVDNDGSFIADSVLGVQLKYRLDDQLDLVGQLVSVGREDYQTRAEWAYLAYRVNNQLRLRIGRFAQPLFMYSENIRVGQAYPWAHLPSEVYFNVSGATSFNGADALYRLPLGDWTLDAQAYVGRTTISQAVVTDDANRQLGVNVTLGNGNLALRAGYNQGDLTFTFNLPPALTPPPITNERATFTELGMSYDDGRWFAAAEATQIRVSGYTQDTDAAFVSVGHYIGKWLPYIGFGKVNIVNGDECRATYTPLLVPLYGPFAAAAADATCRSQLENEQASYSVGFRYDLSRRASLKLQLDHVTDFHDTKALFNGITTATGTLSDDDSTDVITFNINAAF